MTSNPYIHIRSEKFPILDGEEAELVVDGVSLNDGIFGKAFATYLQMKLTDRGYDVPYFLPEDWGWWVAIKGQPFTLGLCVYGFSTDEMDEKQLDLCVTVSTTPQKRWSWTRFRFIDRALVVEKLNHDLKEIVESDPDIEVIGYRLEFPL